MGEPGGWGQAAGEPGQSSVRGPGSGKNLTLLDSLPRFLSAPARGDSVLGHVTDPPVPQDQEGSALEGPFLCQNYEERSHPRLLHLT